MTGLSGSGKTTLARGVQEALGRNRVAIIDGDTIRQKRSNNLGFTKDDRFLHLQGMAELACQTEEDITLVATIAPYRDARESFLEHVAKEKKVILFYNSTTLKICESRDPKGLYKKARSGEVRLFTGISDPYEAPQIADIELDTSDDSIENLVKKLITAVETQVSEK